MRPTTELPPISFQIPSTFDELFNGGSSPAGWSAISRYLSCPESTRLSNLRVHRIPRAPSPDAIPDELSATQFGSLMHALLAIRVAHSPEVAAQWLAESDLARSFHPMSQEKAQTMLRVYEADYPLESEPWEYVGVETTVVTDLGFGALRSARYDKLVRMKRDHALFSLEHKTASRQGSGSATSYTPQMLTQQTIWNKNEALVDKYGRMQGVWIDQLVKTQVPKCERLGPFMFQRVQEDRMVETLRIADKMYEALPVAADGSWPRFFQSCWGRFGPCEYIGLCHDNAIGDYEVRK
jgi:hypothetical protein